MSKSTALAIKTMAPITEVPADATEPPPWANKPLEKLSLYDICPVNYYSRAWLKQFLKDNNMEGIILTTKLVVCEWVENPEEKTADWCNVMYFHETTSRLVLNRSRHLMLGEAFGSRVADWFNRRVILFVGESNHAEGHLQICIAPMDDEASEGGAADNVNEVLFG